MFEELTEDGVTHMSEAMDGLSELEKNTSQAITALRSSQRIDTRTKAGFVWMWSTVRALTGMRDDRRNR